MDIAALLAQVAAQYDRTAGTRAGVRAQELLRQVKDLGLSLPAGLKAAGYGGQGSASRTPWIGVFDADLTDDPKSGLYLAYIFATDLSSVSLTMQQGITELSAQLSARELRERLERSAEKYLKAIPKHLVIGWEAQPNFKPESQDWRAKGYQAASVIARSYSPENLPPEAEMRADLWRAAEALQHAAVKHREILMDFGDVGPRFEYPESGHTDKELGGFRPKDSKGYIAQIAKRTQRKKKRHEVLLNEFSPYVQSRGFEAHNVSAHPRDLVLRKDDSEWLVEAKVIRKANPTLAVREALAQLMEYEYFYYRDSAKRPRLVALFTENIGVYSEYLEHRGIASVWKETDGWTGSVTSRSDGLIDELPG